MKIHPRVLLVAFALLLLSNGFAWAGVIFSDDFNRPGNFTVGNGWVENETNAAEAVVTNPNGTNGELELVGSGTAPSVQQHLSTTGLFATLLEFDWREIAADPSDFFTVLWSTDDVAYAPMGAFQLYPQIAFTHEAIYTPWLDNQPDVFLRFQLTTDDVDILHLDNVTVSAPEPGTLAIMSLGLFGLGVMARRRRYS